MRIVTTYRKNKKMPTRIKNNRNEQEIIVDGLRKHGRKAYETALHNGVTVTVLRGNNICRVDPQGGVSVVARMEKTKVKVQNKKIKLR